MLTIRSRNLDRSRNASGLTSLGRRRAKNARYSLLRLPRRKNTIADEFSNLPISRQRKYQLRMERDKRCTLCGRPVAKGQRCLEHLVRDRELTRKRGGYTRRYNNAFSYKMQADAPAQEVPRS